MNGRLYRLTPAGGKPNHYTDSYASALVKVGEHLGMHFLSELEVGQKVGVTNYGTVERVA
jgi:hypothetical protein